MDVEAQSYQDLSLFGITSGFESFPAMVCPWPDNGTLTSYLERRNGDLEIQQFLMHGRCLHAQGG